jgi:hypothetical protein
MSLRDIIFQTGRQKMQLVFAVGLEFGHRLLLEMVVNGLIIADS